MTFDPDSSTSSVPPPFPPELAGIAHQFGMLRSPTVRAAVAGILYSAMAGALALADQSGKSNGDPLPPLTSEQQAVIDYLQEHGVTPAEELAKHVGYSAGTIKSWCGKDGILRAYGVVPATKGYGLQNHSGQ